MTGSLCILQIPEIITQHLPCLISDSEVRLVVGRPYDLIQTTLDVKKKQPVRLSLLICDVNKLLLVLRHRAATVPRRIQKLIDLVFTNTVNAFQRQLLIADADHQSAAISVGKSGNMRCEIRWTDRCRFPVKVFVFMLRLHIFKRQHRS